MAPLGLAAAGLLAPGCSLFMSFDDDPAGARDDGGVIDATASPDSDDSTPDGATATFLDASFSVPDAFVSDEVVQRGLNLFPATKDTFVRASDPGFNFGIRPRACADTAPDERTMLIQFAPTLPPGAQVERALLHIWTGASPNDLSVAPYTVHEVLEQWNEGGQDAATGNANWTLRRASTPWTTPGAGPGSRATAISGTFTPTQINTEYVVELDPALVNHWISDPASNFGLAIAAWSTDGACFLTRESAATTAPTLDLTWYVPPGAPPP